MCRSCGSPNQRKFNAEINLHFLGPDGLEKPAVWLFPSVVVCMDCGFAEFSTPKAELGKLASGAAA
jgi:hypothetical protein